MMQLMKILFHGFRKLLNLLILLLIYIHCVMGISRSPSIVIGYLMYKKKMKYEEAYDFVKNKRNVISQNPGFQEQLKNFEEILKENNYILPDNINKNKK